MGLAMKRKGTGEALAVMPRVQGSLFADEHQPDAAQSQWYTPPRESKLLCDWARVSPGDRLLEPSAGRGALIEPLPDNEWVAVELDPDNAQHMRERFKGEHRKYALDVRCCDFLACSTTDLGRFDLAIGNPPYEDDMDVAFVLHALEFAPRVVMLLRSAFRHGQARWEQVFRFVDVTRFAELVGRPSFGTGASGNSPMSDFAAFEFQRRVKPRARGEKTLVELEWW